jgi:hypothetical protein
MAAMAWLGIVMSTSQPIAAAAVIDSHRDVGAVMAGLPPRTSTGVSNSGAGGMGMLSSTGWISVSCLLLGAGFLAAVGWFLAAATRSPGGGEGPFNRRHLAHNGIQALTSLGMAVVLREMA